MNQIILNGIIKNIENSHKIGDVQYQKANFLIRNSNGKQSLIDLQFKQFQLKAKEND